MGLRCDFPEKGYGSSDLQTGCIDGCVVDMADCPVSGISVLLCLPWKPNLPIGFAKTDACGKYHIGDILPGCYCLYFDAPGQQKDTLFFSLSHPAAYLRADIRVKSH